VSNLPPSRSRRRDKMPSSAVDNPESEHLRERPDMTNETLKLGLNRLGDAILCFAWGETDRPYSCHATTVEQVRAFLIEQVFGTDKDPMLDEWMQELAEHDWMEDGELRWEFEIGGVKLQDVCRTLDAAIAQQKEKDK
jgi:hypothetical protein